ncbi:MAG: hypothetical protein K0S45_2866 [Nitrospira sp.]|jgi:hypothetical protein|nr:hypothetical protein [Nitrospira sp.]
MPGEGTDPFPRIQFDGLDIAILLFGERSP